MLAKGLATTCDRETELTPDGSKGALETSRGILQIGLRLGFKPTNHLLNRDFLQRQVRRSGNLLKGRERGEYQAGKKGSEVVVDAGL